MLLWYFLALALLLLLLLLLIWLRNGYVVVVFVVVVECIVITAHWKSLDAIFKLAYIKLHLILINIIDVIIDNYYAAWCRDFCLFSIYSFILLYFISSKSSLENCLQSYIYIVFCFLGGKFPKGHLLMRYWSLLVGRKVWMNDWLHLFVFSAEAKCFVSEHPPTFSMSLMIDASG